eukprot:COSAG02_NODE_540_length_20599_cov_14.046339_3_plen_459_part_00
MRAGSGQGIGLVGLLKRRSFEAWVWLAGLGSVRAAALRWIASRRWSDMYASFVSRLEEEVSESEEEFDDPSQDDDDVVRYERTSHHQSRRDELIKRVQAAHAHTAAAAAGEAAGENDRSDEQPRRRPAQDSNEHQGQAQAQAPAHGVQGARQDTLDGYLPNHAARARELEAASAYSFGDDAELSTATTGRTARAGSASCARAAVRDDSLLEAEGGALAARGRGKRKRLQSRSLANLGGRQGGGLDLIGAFRTKQELGPDQQPQGRRAPTAAGRQQPGASHAMRSHSLRPAQQSAQRRGRSGGVDLVGAFRSSARSSQSKQPELPSQRVRTNAGAKVPKSTPAKSHSLRRPDPASADRNRSWTAPPSFLGGPARNLASQGTTSRTFANLQHPAEATQSRLGDKKGLKGERERVVADLKSGAFASERPAVKLKFRMLDGSALLCHSKTDGRSQAGDRHST